MGQWALLLDPALDRVLAFLKGLQGDAVGFLLQMFEEFSLNHFIGQQSLSPATHSHISGSGGVNERVELCGV